MALSLGSGGPGLGLLPLLPVFNLAFLTLAGLLVAVLAARSYLIEGNLTFLFMGSGILAYGVTSMMASFAVPSGGFNAGQTIYYLGVPLAGLLCLLSAFWLQASTSRHFRPNLSILLTAYAAVLVAVMAIYLSAINGLLPAFFVQGVGPTALRQMMLGVAFAAFAGTSLLILLLEPRNRSNFLNWYMLGLALIAVGLLGAVGYKDSDSFLAWVGRGCHYLGGIYLLVAVIAATRESQSWTIPITTLRETYGRYTSLVDASPDAILVLSDGRIVFANPAAGPLFGASEPESLLGLRLLDLVDPASRPVVEGSLGTLSPDRKASAALEVKVLHPSGPAVDAELIAVPVTDEGRQTVQVVLRDISERKRAEVALKESEARYRGLFENIQEAVSLRRLIFDEGGRVLDNVLLDCNPAFLRIIGLDSIEQARGKRGSELFTPGMFSIYIKDVNEAVGTRRTITREVHFDTDDRDYLVSTAPIGTDMIISTSVDITETKRVHRAVEEERARLKAVLDAAPIGIAIGDSTGKVVLMNGTGREIWGMGAQTPGSFEEYRQFKAWHSGTDEVFTRENLPSTRALRGEANTNLVDIERFDGRQATIIISAVPLRGSDGTITGVVTVAQDVTDLKRVQDELHRSNSELQQFAYVASHDLREPLRMVSSYLDILEKWYQGKILDSKAEEYIHFAVDGADRMRQMIDDLLTYSRIDTQGKPFAPVDMDEVLTTALKDLKVPIEEGNASVTNDALPTISADGTQMVLLLENLLSNAIKYRGEEAPEIHVEARGDGREWVFSVADNGIGIDPRQKDRVFQMFQRLHTREEYEGTGIGLAVAKKIVERHGGRIWFESEPGKGTTFFFTIPSRRPDEQVR